MAVQCLSCFETLGVKVIGGHPYCNLCHHRADVTREQCDCPLCFPLPGPPVLTTDSIDLPPLPEDDSADYGALIARMVEADGTGIHSGDVQVVGRLLKSPSVVVDVTTDFVRIRIDDNADPEQWIEVVIFDEAVGKWWRMMCDADDIRREKEGQE